LPAQNVGASTSKNTKYARTELREMLRTAEHPDKDGPGITGNTWVLQFGHGSDAGMQVAVEGSA